MVAAQTGGCAMKLRFLSAIFQLTALLCSCTSALNRCAGKLHVAAWGACTKENLRTLNVRKVARLRVS